MAQTARITKRSTAPTTDFYAGADIIAQSQAGNYSVVRLSAAAVNRGSTGSYDASNSSHVVAIDGISGGASYYGTMPSGYANGSTRWDNYSDVTVGHAADGTRSNVTIRQSVGWAWGYVDTASFGGFVRIPKRPSVPGTPVATEVLPTSLRLTWTASTDDAGSTITGYLVRRWDNPEGTGTYVDDFANDLTRVLTGLTPGKEYRFAIYARNGSADNDGYSNISTAIVVRTLSGLWIRSSDVWKRAVPFVKVAGVWRQVSVFIKDADVWKRGG